MDEIKLKRCEHCRRELPADLYHFYHNKNDIDGFDGRCRECRGYPFKKAPTRDGYKVCQTCGDELPQTTEWFYFREDTKKFKNTCINCCHKLSRSIYKNDSQSAIEYQIAYRETHRDYINKRQRIYYEKNKEVLRERASAYDKAHPELRRLYWQNVGRFNLQSKVANNFRRRINAVLHGSVKCSHSLELLGCTREELMQHLESQFTDGMTWGNYGRGKNKWHMDHIIPPPYFDLDDPEQQRICFHYSNLQPLWGGPNISKSSWYNGVFYRYKK